MSYISRQSPMWRDLPIDPIGRSPIARWGPVPLWLIGYGFMEACAGALEHWPQAAGHFEYFKVPTAPTETGTERDRRSNTDEFDVVVASTGQTVHVGPHRTIMEALADAGGVIDTFSMSGLSGTCKVRRLSVQSDHRGSILSDEGKKSHLTPCVSRCLSGLPVLNL
jgi:hypothetical protein